MLRKAFLGIFTVLLTMMLLAPGALAVDVREGSRMTIGSGETIEDDILFSGVSAIIDGTVKGDVFVFADNVVINGTIEGNLVVISSTLDVKGRVTGSTLAGSEDLLVTGKVDRNLVTAGGTLRIDQSATVGHNWIAFGEILRTDGRIDRGILAAADSLTIDGLVARDVKAYIDDLNIGSNAQVAGSVEYHSERQASVASGARTGELIFRPEKYEFNWESNTWTGVGLAIGFGGFLAVGLILLSLFPQLRLDFYRSVAEKPWQTPLVGLLILLVTPIAAILVMITLVGLPLGLLSLLLYPLAIYFGQVLLSWTVGRLVADRWTWLGTQHWVVIFLAGALITTIMVEALGFAAGFIAVIYGLGGLYFAYIRSRNPNGVAL